MADLGKIIGGAAIAANLREIAARERESRKRLAPAPERPRLHMPRFAPLPTLKEPAPPQPAPAPIEEQKPAVRQALASPIASIAMMKPEQIAEIERQKREAAEARYAELERKLAAMNDELARMKSSAPPKPSGYKVTISERDEKGRIAGMSIDPK